MKKLIVLSIFSLAIFFAQAADSTSVSLQIGLGSKLSTIRVLDKTTGAALTATVTNIVIQNNNPEIATATTDATVVGSVRVTPVASGNGTALVTCHVTYTDPGDGLQKSEDKTIVLSITVSGTPHGAKLSLAY